MRTCGGCTACCKLVGNETLHKAPGVRCVHQKFKTGCAIYKDRPQECAQWFCLWLVSDLPLSRPDRSHFVIDTVLDKIHLMSGGVMRELTAVQVWIDPSFRAAYHDPTLRAYLTEQAAQHGYGAVIRYTMNEGFVVLPPAISPDGTWFEIGEKVHAASGSQPTSNLGQPVGV